ncbi:IclR family transcriptional regulator [Subtercola lobariae]|uniref:IclR family transcriptional regulator n=1 Tax=Subtercola lobariae TaxID=1588641 RepID=A0A917BCP3_9MICO|nr:IclR family transcriptional regulator [Subtercola lobariae]GGF36277.1 hypothetical protein GCM10011399_31500 [Subtercola lobariae]
MSSIEVAADATGMSAVSKAMRVLTALAHTGELTAAELAAALDEPITTVYRMLSNLEAIGWIERENKRGGVVRLGIDLVAVGESVEESLDSRQTAFAALSRINEQTHETSYLCVRDGNRAACIERIDGRYTRTAELPIGGSLPLHQGAGPRAILAFEPEVFQERYLSALASAQLNPMNEADLGRLTAELRQARRTGIAISDGDVTPGIYSVAAPIFNHRAEVVGSITLSSLRAGSDARFEEYDQLIRSEARTISTQLGHQE